MYCPHCNLIVHTQKCPVCGSNNMCEPQANDYCYLTEKDTIWAGAMSDLLKQNNIPFISKNLLGAGLAARMGPALERTRFYVPYSYYSLAQELEKEFFSADFSGGI